MSVRLPRTMGTIPGLVIDDMHFSSPFSQVAIRVGERERETFTVVITHPKPKEGCGFQVESPRTAYFSETSSLGGPRIIVGPERSLQKPIIACPVTTAATTGRTDERTDGP